MRKYYQAGLAIIAAVSLISLLFYRHEYNKLHYVLEVFNYFGEPRLKDGPDCTNTIIQKPPHLLCEPLPSWLRLNDNLYLYSSYNIDNKQIRTIAFGKINENLRCAVYLADEKYSTVFGTVVFQSIKNTQEDIVYNVQGYLLNCNFESSFTPVGVKYFSEAGNIQDASIMAVKNSPANLKGSDYAMCILPSDQFVHLEEKLSFITVQNIIGIQYFLIYDYGIDSWFNAEIKRSTNVTFVYETVPWNFPYPKVNYNIVRNLVQADCLLRTRNVAAYATTVQWGQFLKPDSHSTINDWMFNLYRTRINVPCYSLKVASFCSQHPGHVNANKSVLPIFRFNVIFPSVRVPDVWICKPHKTVHETNLTSLQVSEKLIKVHRYSFCPTVQDYLQEHETIIDNSMLSFEEVVLNAIDKFRNEVL